MDAYAMMKTAAVLLALAAAGGLLMASIRFRGADRPPTAVLMAHGVLTTAALTLLIYAALTVGLPSLGNAATVLLVFVALVGAGLNLMYHAKGLPIPKTPIAIHGTGAVIGFVMLLLALAAGP